MFLIIAINFPGVHCASDLKSHNIMSISLRHVCTTSSDFLQKGGVQIFSLKNKNSKLFYTN